MEHHTVRDHTVKAIERGAESPCSFRRPHILSCRNRRPVALNPEWDHRIPIINFRLRDFSGLPLVFHRSFSICPGPAVSPQEAADPGLPGPVTAVDLLGPGGGPSAASDLHGVSLYRASCRGDGFCTEASGPGSFVLRVLHPCESPFLGPRSWGLEDQAPVGAHL